MTILPDTARRDAARRRSAEYRERRRAGEMLATVVVGRTELHALERLGLLQRGERDAYAVACACATFLACAPGVVLMGELLFPAGEGAGDNAA